MEEKLYRVEDSESGNFCIYEGNQIVEAFKSIIGDGIEDSELWDLYCDGERIWCGKTDSITELMSIVYTNPAFGKKVGDYIGALYNAGADATLIETWDEAISMFLKANDDDTVIGAIDADESDEARLDLDGLQHDTIHFFRASGEGCWTSICFSWEQ